jgi:hypothetical protein
VDVANRRSLFGALLERLFRTSQQASGTSMTIEALKAEDKVGCWSRATASAPNQTQTLCILC